MYSTYEEEGEGVVTLAFFLELFSEPVFLFPFIFFFEERSG